MLPIWYVVNDLLLRENWTVSVSFVVIFLYLTGTLLTQNWKIEPEGIRDVPTKGL